MEGTFSRLAPIVIKRDGTKVGFNAAKIVRAIEKAMESVGNNNKQLAIELGNEAAELASRKEVPTVEEIQDCVEQILVSNNMYKEVKTYILFRQRKTDLRNTDKDMVSVNDMVGNYLGMSDWRVQENSNEQFSFSGLLLYTASRVLASYNLNHIYTPAIAAAHDSGVLHIHDLPYGSVAYCAGWSLKNLLMMGFGGVAGKADCKPAKHLNTIVHQMVNYIGCMQMEFAGAQAFNSVDTLLAPFVRADNLTYEQTKQCIQQLIFSLNIPNRWGSQFPFSNFSFDIVVPEDLKENKGIVGGQEMNFTFGDCQAEMDMINKAFLEIMIEGDAAGRMFSFPIPTYNLTKDFDWDSDIATLLFEMTAKYGTPYFQNYIGSNLNPNSVRAMCLVGTEEIVVRIGGEIVKTTMQELIASHSIAFDEDGWSLPNKEIEAMSMTSDYRLEWTPIKTLYKTKGNDLVKITTNDGKHFTASSDHPIPTITKAGVVLKAAKYINTNDVLLTTRSAKALLNKKATSFGKYELDGDLAFLLGLFVADGNYLYDSRKEGIGEHSLKGLQFSLNTNEAALISRACSIIKDKFGYQPKLKKDPRYNCMQIYVYSVELAKELYSNGLRKYNQVPQAIFNSSADIIRAFLDGFFAGDGYDSRQEIHINDLSLFRDLTSLYTLVGTPVTVAFRENSQVLHIQNTNSNMPTLYEKIPTKVVSIEDISGARRYNVRKAKSVGTKLLEAFGGHSHTTLALQNDVAPVYVRSVEHIQSDTQVDLFDIELQDNHLFVHSLGVITHNCCRLNMDLNELRENTGGMWGAGDNTGSIGVTTINMNRIGYEARDEAEFFDILAQRMGLCRDALEIKRRVINKNLSNNLMPYTKAYLPSFRSHFSTIGLCGMHECCVNFLGKGIETEEGKSFTIKVLGFMRGIITEYQKETGSLYNLEATPAESTSYRFAKLDKEIYADIFTSGNGTPFLTNSTQLPVGHTDDIFEALEHQNAIQPLYNGGTVFHVFLGERLPNAEACKNLVKKIAVNTKLPYFSISPTFSVCKDHGYIKGTVKECPECHKETEVFSRIVGYYRPIKNWNKGKAAEFKERRVFKAENTML